SATGNAVRSSSEASGFARLYNRLPQEYTLALVQAGSEPSVTFIPLDGLNHAQVQLDLGDGSKPTYLIVMGRTRHTWQSAPYEFEIGR
ncbi:MAG: hypothetical protein ACK2TX_02565, partial [Anaerolineales bacterium]